MSVPPARLSLREHRAAVALVLGRGAHSTQTRADELPHYTPLGPRTLTHPQRVLEESALGRHRGIVAPSASGDWHHDRIGQGPLSTVVSRYNFTRYWKRVRLNKPLGMRVYGDQKYGLDRQRSDTTGFYIRDARLVRRS